MVEVELKFAVPDVAGFLKQVRDRFGELTFVSVQESDEYFQHPCRDFNVTDEALRIRQSGDSLSLTWKGPRLDSTTKTREEREMLVHCLNADMSGNQLRSVLLALGFDTAGYVCKRREVVAIQVAGYDGHLCLDRVDGLPEPYAELEILCAEHDRKNATQCLMELAQALGLSASERRSYLDLVGQRRVG